MAKGGVARQAKNKTEKTSIENEIQKPSGSKMIKLNVRRIVKEEAPKQVKKRKAKKIITDKAEREEIKKHVDELIRQAVIREKAERQKRTILWTGVIFFMAVIFIGWIFSLKNSFQAAGTRETIGKFNDMSNNLDDEITELKNNMREAKELFKIEDSNEASSTTRLFATSSEEVIDIVPAGIASTTDENQKTSEEIENLRLKISELEKKIK